MDIGYTVTLNKKDIKNFYETNIHLKMYEVRNEFTSNSFIEFVGDYLGFYSGKESGVISGYGSLPSIFQVTFYNPVKRKFDVGYFDESELLVVYNGK